MNKYTITVVDTKYGEMRQYSVGTFSLNFIIGKDLPNLVIIFNYGKEHKCFDLNTVFNGSGCSTTKFENWFKREILTFDEECKREPKHWEVNKPDWFRSCGEDL